MQWCVVTQVLMSKKVNDDTFRVLMLSLWKIHNSTKIELAQDNIFFIQSRSMLEKLCLGEGSLNWTFDRVLIILKSSKDFESICNMALWKFLFGSKFTMFFLTTHLEYGSSSEGHNYSWGGY